MKFGDYLKQCRSDKGWTQPEAAHHIEIEQSYLSKLETGKAAPSDDVFTRLSSVYGIDAAAMTGVLFPAELDRLREIGVVRQSVLRYDQDIKRVAQAWLIAALVLLMLGGAFIGLTQMDRGGEQTLYTYKSPGILKPEENAFAFEFLDQKRGADNYDDLVSRLDEQIKSIPENRGPNFTEEVEGGRRFWTLIGGDTRVIPAKYQWGWPLGFALLAGAIGCFAIGRRWPGLYGDTSSPSPSTK